VTADTSPTAPADFTYASIPIGDAVYATMRATMRLVCGVILDGLLSVEGAENVPRHGGLLVVSNHVGTIDPPLLGAYLPRPDTYFMAKSEYFEHPVGRLFIAGYHAFPVVRGTADRTALRHALKLLTEGHAVVLYPEGHRSPDGNLQRALPGAGFLARTAGVPVLPVGLWGTSRVLPIGARWPRRAPIHVRFGEAAPIPTVDAHGRRLSSQQIADLLMRRVAAVLPRTRRGVFADGAAGATAPPPAL